MPEEFVCDSVLLALRPCLWLHNQSNRQSSLVVHQLGERVGFEILLMRSHSQLIQLHANDQWAIFPSPPKSHKTRKCYPNEVLNYLC